ncbi:MAG: AMP-binding protein [Treponema sp.]|nr:AMP-binding protein [Treponema sp.]
MNTATTPWAFLDAYRGTYFSGEWPTLPEMFRITTKRYGERPCLTIYEGDERISLTYSQTLAKIEAVSRWLYAQGIRKGDKVAVTGKNTPEWAVAYLAVLFAGATVVPIDYQLKQEEIELLLKTADVTILFVDEEKHGRFVEQPGQLKTIISLKKGVGTYIYDLDGPEASIEGATETDLAAILFTSGTTGNPKGVMLTHKNFVSDCYLAQSNLNIYHTDVFYALLPIHHSYTMLAVFIEALSVGAELVFGKRIVTKAILKDLKEAKVTMFLGVPVLFNAVLNGIMKGIKAKGPLVYGIIRIMMSISGFIKKVFKVNPGKKMFHSILDKASLSSIRICISGGGPLAPSVFKQYNQLGIDFVQGYGLTETSPIITLNPKEHYKETSVGKVLPQVDMKILNPDEQGVGEIIVKGPMVMQGYYKMPEETRETFTEDGYLKTGDLGYLDSEQYLYLTGRAKNLIVTEGGKNVYPEEIENEFQLYGEIEQILVRGYLLDAKMKIEGIEALVYPNQEAFKDEVGALKPKAEIKQRIEAIIAEVNQRLKPYQKIERVIVLDEPMEMTTTKKIKRSAVKI